MIVVGAGGELGEDGELQMLVEIESVGGTQRGVGHGKTLGQIVGSGPGHDAQRGLPVATAETEGRRQLEIRREGAVGTVVHAVETSEVGVPCGREEAEVVADRALEGVPRLAALIIKIR